ncbi:MAG TPA: peptidoglycan DD-metalloendopeptidase family protein [Bryobacteraceae bacterium]|nr:peptidoglycan DD-metalloendopeptidase family protein [Bryobacteraceae bacterium]
MRARGLLLVSTFVLAPAAGAITVRDSRITASASEETCAAPKPAAEFQPTARQAFLWFAARRVRSGDQLRVEWVDPAGAVSTTADYGELPNAPELCFTSQLPIAGFAPASQPGTWKARVFANGALLFSREFRIAAELDTGGPVVTSVKWSGLKAQEIDFTVQGKNFQPNSLVFIAEYTRAGGWTYLANLQPRTATKNQLVVHYAGLPANEYLVMVENADQRMSRPMPFLIESGGYKLPMPAGEPWIVTQGPYGTFSHWGNSLHAYDIAPRSGRCVVAMKAGIAYTHDLGLKQDHRHHSFGNYITIDHGNGEFSHYAHLATGTFVVENGQRVEQGQALAIAGNSGYTLGEGGGYHVHVSVTRALAISAQSIPFQFEELPETRRVSWNRVVVSSNASTLCDCRERHPGEMARNPAGPPMSGQVSVAQWWTELVTVPKGARTLEVSLAWQAAASQLDLHLMSPSGRHYGWYGDTSGYSGANTNPQEFHVARPEPGVWRISVEGVRGGPGPIEFAVHASPASTDSHLAASRPMSRPSQ